MAKNILIVSYFFPPCNKVGGRRWAKFGKYLNEKAYNISVVAVNVPFEGTCPWENDIENYKTTITRLPYIEHRPYYRVNKAPVTIGGKINYRLSLYKEKFFPGKTVGDTTDVSRKYGTALQKTASEIIRQRNIDTVIITGGPFHWCYEAIQLKKQFSTIKFITDLRDFWTGGEVYAKLSDTDKREEDQKELECVTLSDIILSPAGRIVDFLRSKYPGQSSKIHVLPHAYDGSEIPVNTQPNKQEGIITFAYGGILYPNMADGIKKLIELLKKIISGGIKTQLDIYTFDNSYKELFLQAGLHDSVAYHKSILPKKLFEKFSQTDYLLQLRAGESQEQHFKSTKFYELIALKKPVIYFGPKGDVSEFIIENKLGFDGNTNTEQLAAQLIENKKKRSIPDENFDVSRFEFRAVTETLEKYL